MMQQGILKSIGVKKSPPNIFPTAGNLQPGSSFFADYLQEDGMRGGGVVGTFTRATTATIIDQDLVVRNCLSGERRKGGFRRVQNLLTFTEDFSNAAWTVTGVGTGSVPTKTSGFTAPDGSNSAWRIQCNRGAGNTGGDFSIVRQSYVAPVGSARNHSIWMKSNTGVNQSVLIYGATGALQTVTPTWQRYSLAVASSLFIDIGTQGTTGSSQIIDVLVWHPQVEETTGQTNINPSEYVSKNVLSAPYQGANVDGVQYFNYLNGNTVASAVVIEATGAPISSSILGGLLIEPTATDLLLARADARDMTTANWTLGATMTRARTSIGADGVANKATRLTGGAVAGTNTISQTLALAAATRTYSVLVKRVTGVGTINITQDGLGTSLDIAPLINSSTYTLVQISGNTLNPIYGIQIMTNGDAIDVDWNQYQTGDLTGLVNSRIPEAISTRNADTLTYATTGWLNAVAGTLYTEWFQSTNAIAASKFVASLNDNTSNNRISTYSNNPTEANYLVVTGGVNQSNLFVFALTAGAVAKEIAIWQANDFAGFANNTTLGTDVAGTIPTISQLEIGCSVGANQLGHYIRKVAYYPSRLPSSIAQPLTV